MSLKSVIFPLLLLIWLLKPFLSSIFLSIRYSKSLFSSVADGYNLYVFCSIYISINHTNLPKHKAFPV